MPRRVIQPLQFHELSLDHDDRGGIGSLEATHPKHGFVGQIYWNTDPKYKGEKLGGVTNLNVERQFQGQGIATNLYREAQRRDPRVQHGTNPTTQGKKFVKAVGP